MAGVGLLVIPAGAGSYIAKDPIVAAAGASLIGGLVGTLIGGWGSREGEAGAF